MDHDSKHRETLAAAGYTGRRGAVLFCLVLAAVGGLLGSVVVAILWNMAAPGTPETLSSAIGAGVGAALGAMLGLLKVRQGNIDAREDVEDREWRRLVKRQHADKAP